MTNFRHDRYGTQAYFRHKGKLLTHRVATRTEEPSDAAREQMALEWIDNARASLQLGLPIPEQTGPAFPEDVTRYLKAVTSMPTYSDRERDMLRWAAIFRGRDRNSITPLEIRTHLEGWRVTKAASTCNKRRTALMSFYTELNGRSGYNPVRDVEKYPEEEEIRSQHPYTILRVLSFMRPSQTRARLMVILTTGWPHAQLKRLKPEHLKLDQARAFVTPRQKGKRGKVRRGKWLPLLPAAVNALREFVKWDCFTKPHPVTGKPRPFSHSAMHSAFARALEKLNAHRARLGSPALDIHPYDLRHVFGTWLAHQLTDERAIQELMIHSRIEQTRRYTEAATQGRVERAVAGITVAIATQAVKSRANASTRVEKKPRNLRKKH